MDMFAGNGSPVFFYYPPLAYFITALFSFLSPLDAFGYYPIAASALLAVIVSGFSFYLWMKEENASSEAALLGSLLYIAAPSHIAQDFYHSLLFASVWAYAWIPLLLMFAKRLGQNGPYGLPGFALMLGLLILTNLPVTIIFGPFAVGYSLLHFHKNHALPQTWKLALATMLGFCVAATLLVPVFFYHNAANIDVQWVMTGIDTYEKSYFFMGFDLTVNNFFVLYWVVACLLLFFYFHAAAHTSIRVFLAGTSALAFILMIPLSKPLWDALLPLKMLQMSERLFIVPSVSLAFLAVLSLPRLRLLSWILVGVYGCITLFVACESRTTMEEFKKNEPARYANYQLSIDQYANYLTSRDLTPEFGTPAGVADLRKHLEKITVLAGDATAEVKQWQPRHITIHYQASQPATLQIRQFAFPGWKASDGNQEFDIRRDEKTGQIILDIPTGSGEIYLDLTRLFPEIAGEFISIISIAILLLLVLIEAKRSTARRLA